MNKSSIFLLPILALGLTACGKSIPECGDEKVQQIVIKTITDEFAAQMSKKEIEPSVTAWSKLYDAVLGSNIQHKSPFLEVTEKSGINLKLDAISSTKKDKDSGFNYCSAKLIGTITGELRIAPAAGNDLVLKKVMSPDGGDHNLGMAIVGIPMIGMAQFLDNLSRQPGVASVKFDAKTVEALIKFGTDTSQIDEIKYTANFSDKGDQLIVKVKED
jgi:hypothetical protein